MISIIRTKGTSRLGSSVLKRASPGAFRAYSDFSSDTEFTIHPYRDVKELGYDRHNEFCMLTMRHPVFQGIAEAEKDKLWADKKANRLAYIHRMFDKVDDDSSGTLDARQLAVALEKIGLRSDEGAIAGILQRQDHGNTGTISREEFPNVVAEAWGKVPCKMNFSNKLDALHAKTPFAPLNGDRAVGFLGRDSPAGWMLKSIRNMYPFALKRAAILRNTENNPNLNPEKMEVVLNSYEESGQLEFRTVAQLAKAAEIAPVAKGGFVTRLVYVNENPEEEPLTLYVPLRGLPENKTNGGLMGWFGR
eukprot:TRINITY_DN69838_c0_g1_i1.p1 TRINITY_DN69838_c0_g1~~TRINITY_DN69838_c0_g1_i1.p1  ORF type:complete len:305 (-),score=31.95 TRINITY_DN69838_c0_g1_i1:167-1081(-)